MLSRLFLAILFVTLVTMSVPSLRVKADPYLESAGRFIVEKLEGPMSPILNPYRKLKSQSEMEEAVRELLADRNQGFLRPRPDDFRTWMQREVEGEDGLDAWGTPYVMVPLPDSLKLLSAGPDREYETEDDVSVTIRYGAPAYMPRR